MTDTTATQTTASTAQVTARKRFSFGPVWNQAVLDGKVKDHEKLIAQAVKLKVAARSDAKRLKFETLLAKVQNALKIETQTAAE